MRALQIAVLALLVFGLADARADEERFKVIVHPDHPADAVGRDFLRNAYLKKVLAWGHGGSIRPIDLADKFAVRARFTREVLRKTPSQLKTYWNQQIFSGKGVPPPEAKSPADVVAYVLANPGAIGYLPADVDHGRARVVRIE